MTAGGAARSDDRPAKIRRGPASLLGAFGAGDELFGTFVKSPDTNVVEAVVRAGYDFLIVDLEHSTLTMADVAGIVRTAELEAVPVIVRLTPVSLESAGRALDAGAAGIQVTDVGSLEVAESARAAVEYPPSGRRGLSFSHRAASFGLAPAAAYLAQHRRTPLIGQIESREALVALPALLRSTAFDALFLGPADLAASLGHPGDPDHESVRDALDEAATLVLANSTVLGVFARDADEASAWRSRGATFIASGSDLTLLARAARHEVATFSAHGRQQS